MARVTAEEREYQDYVDAFLIAHNARRETYAAERRRERAAREHQAANIDGEAIEQAFNDFELRCMVWREIENIARRAGVTDRQRQCLLLRYHIGSTICEAADALDVSERTVRYDTAQAIGRISTFCEHSPYALLWEVLRDIFGSRVLRLANCDK